MNQLENEPNQILEVLTRKAQTTARALGSIENFHQKITSTDYPLVSPQFPKGLDLIVVSDDPVEFTRRTDKIDEVASVSVPRSLAVGRFRLANLEDALSYGKRLALYEVRVRTGMMTRETYQSSVDTFRRLADYAINPFRSQKEKPQNLGQAQEAAKRKLKYEIRDDCSVQFVSGRILKGRLAQIFSIISQSLPAGISGEQLTVDIYGENTPANRDNIQTAIGTLRKIVTGDGISIPGNAPLPERRKGVKARYTMGGIEIEVKENAVAEPKVETKKKMVPHPDPIKLTALKYLIEHSLASIPEIIEQMGIDEKTGEMYKTGKDVAYALKGQVGLLFTWHYFRRNQLTPIEKEVYEEVLTYIKGHKLAGKREFQVWLDKRLQDD